MGNAYFPSGATEKEYLERVPQIQKGRSKGAKGGTSTGGTSKDELQAVKEKLVSLLPHQTYSDSSFVGETSMWLSQRARRARQEEVPRDGCLWCGCIAL